MKTAIISLHTFVSGWNPPLDLSDHRDEIPILNAGVAASIAGTSGGMKGA